MAPRDGFDDFRDQFKKLSSWTATGATAAPIADYWLKLGPPWPAGLVPVATSVVELVCLVCIFRFFRTHDPLKVNRYLIILVIVLCGAFFLYLALSSSYTIRLPSGELIVKGFELQPDVKPEIKNDFTPDDALRGSEYVPERVWTNRTITIMRLCLIAGWLVMFISLSSFLGIFVLVQQQNWVGRARQDS